MRFSSITLFNFISLLVLNPFIPKVSAEQLHITAASPVPLNHTQVSQVLDLRGVGDAGMALRYQQPFNLDETLPGGVIAHFGQRLDQLDPTGQSYRGDLSMLNWESAIGTYCQQFRDRRSNLAQ